MKPSNGVTELGQATLVTDYLRIKIDDRFIRKLSAGPTVMNGMRRRSQILRISGNEKGVAPLRVVNDRITWQLVTAGIHENL